MREWAQCCIAAYLLDLCLGDPAWLPHPVAAIGALIRGFERHLYHARWRRAAGVALLLLTVAITVGCVGLVLAGAARLPAGFHFAVATLLLWMAFATRSLVSHGEAVRRPLAAGELPAARCALARIVARDTAELDAAAIARACVESLAENLTDGCLSPFLFGLVAGPLGAWGLKAVSTLDSMVGYRNPRYREFGWASARCDDVLHWLPARTLYLLLPLASALLGLRARACARWMLRDGGKSPSPNSGIPEAGFAGALNIELGGPSVYQGLVMAKPRLHAGAPPPDAAAIRRAQRLVLAASALPLLPAIAMGLR